MTKEPTIQDVLEAISEFSTRVDERFDSVEHRLSSVESDVGTLKSDVGTLKSDVGTLKSDVATMKSQMVTKDYLDSRLDALRGDLVALTRKLNVKLSVLVERLVKEGSLKQNTADLILALEPFAQ
jgi:polyhydroxyalkanoate synthesis regulator phasin